MYEYSKHLNTKCVYFCIQMGGSGPRDRWGDIYANAPVKKMIALYDYDPQELSPNVDAEVELVTKY
jgi:hypothetical protein